jgi:hypothetical protein
MNSIIRQIVLFLVVFSLYTDCYPGTSGSDKIAIPSPEGGKDSVDIQVLYNGRAWRNLYYRVKGDQFLFSNDFLNGVVSISGTTFRSLRLKYDIFTDEVILVTDHGVIIQLNKEKVDQFSLYFQGKRYNFINTDADSLELFSGYVNILTEGKVSLCAKYRKEILQLAVENKYDLFSQINRVYMKKGGKFYRIDSKRGVLNLMEDKKHELHAFIRTNRLKFSRKNPESFIPLVEYYNKISQ